MFEALIVNLLKTMRTILSIKVITVITVITKTKTIITTTIIIIIYFSEWLNRIIVCDAMIIIVMT